MPKCITVTDDQRKCLRVVTSSLHADRLPRPKHFSWALSKLFGARQRQNTARGWHLQWRRSIPFFTVLTRCRFTKMFTPDCQTVAGTLEACAVWRPLRSCVQTPSATVSQKFSTSQLTPYRLNSIYEMIWLGWFLYVICKTDICRCGVGKMFRKTDTGDRRYREDVIHISYIHWRHSSTITQYHFSVPNRTDWPLLQWPLF